MPDPAARDYSADIDLIVDAMLRRGTEVALEINPSPEDAASTLTNACAAALVTAHHVLFGAGEPGLTRIVASIAEQQAANLTVYDPDNELHQHLLYQFKPPAL